MDVIIANEEYRELGFLPYYTSLDIEIGDANDFELTVPLGEYEKNKTLYGIDYLVFIPNTEYGGAIKGIKVDTAAGTVIFTGDTWRGMLTKKIIEPPFGQDYRIVSGEANAIIGGVLGSLFGGFMQANPSSSGIVITSYQFARYCTFLEGLTSMLNTINSRLNICTYYDSYGKVYVQISAVPVVDLSDSIEASQDTLVDFKISKSARTINHLICLGQGELKNRVVINLYLQADGSIGSNIYYTGIQERVAVYNYGNAESTDELTSSGIKKLQEFNIGETQELVVNDDIKAALGDIVGGRDRITGTYIKTKVTKKILIVKNGCASIEYKVGD